MKKGLWCLKVGLAGVVWIDLFCPFSLVQMCWVNVGVFFFLSFCFENMIMINCHLITNLMDDFRIWLSSLHKADIDSFIQLGFL